MYFPANWHQGFMNTLNQVNEKKKKDGKGYDCFHVLYYAVHMEILVRYIL